MPLGIGPFIWLILPKIYLWNFKSCLYAKSAEGENRFIPSLVLHSLVEPREMELKMTV